MATTKPPVLPTWANSGDTIQPSNAEIEAGWPVSSTPPSRQRFNWAFNYFGNAIRYLLSRGMPEWDSAENYLVNARVLASDGNTYKALQASVNQNPITATADWERWGFSLSELNLKAPLASPALTGTPTAPTAAVGTNTTQLATTAFVTAADALKAPLASPALTGTPTAPTATAGTNTTQLATTAFVTAADAAHTALIDPHPQYATNTEVSALIATQLNANNPAGTILFHGATTPPTGYLKANGAAVSRTSYAALFAAIGTTFGSGDGSTTFNVPDLRGEFLRGLDDGRGVDAGRVIGSWQKPTAIIGNYDTSGIDVMVGDIAWNKSAVRAALGMEAPSLNGYSGNFSYNQLPISSGPNQGAVPYEDYSHISRPRNISLLVCIKY